MLSLAEFFCAALRSIVMFSSLSLSSIYLDTCEKPGNEFDITIAKIKELREKYNQIEAEEREQRRQTELDIERKELEKRKLIIEQQKKELADARKTPQNYDEVILEGVKKLGEHEYAQAREYFQKAININPLYPNAYHNLGLTYFSQTNYAEAVKYFQKAISKNDKYADSHLTLGLTYIKLNKPNDAIENFIYYLELAPKTSYANWVKDWLTKNAGAR